MRIRYTEPALADLDEILRFIGVNAPEGAKKVQRRLQAMIDFLVLFPLAGRRTSDGSIRRILVSPYPYLIFYEVRDQDIFIHAVRHAARDPLDNPGGN